MRAQFSGPVRYRLLAVAGFCRSVIYAWLRRVVKGPRRPGWNWTMELGTEVLRTQLRVAFTMPVNQSRSFLDSFRFDPPALSRVEITPVSQEAVRGSWFVPRASQPKLTVLYLHGGGYSYYPKAHAGLIALITLKANARTFALDYRLSPEHCFPAQLEDGVNAYQWLLNTGVSPNHLVVAGDSAGGNLALVLLFTLRDRHLPLPALAVAMSPPVDFGLADKPDAGGGSMVANAPFDWIEAPMLLKWAGWFCQCDQRMNPLVSPMYADLRGLPPIYIQAGRAEILYDSIEAFATSARKAGVNVTLESWADMNHDFQMFGSRVPQSAEALRRLGEVIKAHAGNLQNAPTR